MVTPLDPNRVWNKEYVGLSTNSKPTLDTHKLNNGDRFIEMDTGKIFMWDSTGSDWLPFELGGPSVVVEPLTATENKTYTAPSGKAYSPVEVNVPNPSTGEIEIIENGTYDVTEKASAVVNVPIPEPELESKTVTVTENGTTTIIPSEGKDGLSEVELTVNVPNPSTGEITITENGTYDVTEKASAVVTVSSGDSKEDEIISRTISGAYTNTTATSVGENAFRGCARLTEVTFTACSIISYGAFINCERLTTASFPACTSIGSSAFYVCGSLTTISFPVCTTIGSSAFDLCTSLTEVTFPTCTTIEAYAFESCIYITTASFPACSNIKGYGAFRGCVRLTELTVGTEYSSVCYLYSSTVFSSCSALTSIYVPASLLTAYQSATNWAYFSSKLVGV